MQGEINESKITNYLHVKSRFRGGTVNFSENL